MMLVSRLVLFTVLLSFVTFVQSQFECNNVFTTDGSYSIILKPSSSLSSTSTIIKCDSSLRPDLCTATLTIHESLRVSIPPLSDFTDANIRYDVRYIDETVANIDEYYSNVLSELTCYDAITNTTITATLGTHRFLHTSTVESPRESYLDTIPSIIATQCADKAMTVLFNVNDKQKPFTTIQISDICIQKSRNELLIWIYVISSSLGVVILLLIASITKYIVHDKNNINKTAEKHTSAHIELQTLHTYTVEFNQSNFGMTLENVDNGSNVTVSGIEPTSLAELNGIKRGSKIVSINDIHVLDTNAEEIKIILQQQSATLPVSITFADFVAINAKKQNSKQNYRFALIRMVIFNFMFFVIDIFDVASTFILYLEWKYDIDCTTIENEKTFILLFGIIGLVLTNMEIYFNFEEIFTDKTLFYDNRNNKYDVNNKVIGVKNNNFFFGVVGFIAMFLSDLCIMIIQISAGIKIGDRSQKWSISFYFSYAVIAITMAKALYDLNKLSQENKSDKRKISLMMCLNCCTCCPLAGISMSIATLAGALNFETEFQDGLCFGTL